MENKTQKCCFIQFKLNYQTSPGEDIHITGNIPSLGDWSIEKSEKMVTNQQEYPVWKSKENIIAQQDSEIQYKYLIFNRGKFQRWEKTENNANRSVKIGKFYKIVVYDPGSKIVHCISATEDSQNNNSLNSKSDNLINEDKLIDSNIRDTILNNSNETDNNFIGQSYTTKKSDDFQILSDKKNIILTENLVEKINNLYPDLDVDVSVSNNSENKEFSNPNLGTKNYTQTNINNIFDESLLINGNIFNNIINNNSIDEKEIAFPQLEEVSKIEKNKDNSRSISSDNMISFNDSTLNNLNLNNNQYLFYQKIIICSFHLPIEIVENSLKNSSETLYQNLVSLSKENDSKNIYYIGFLKNNNSLSIKKQNIVYTKLKNNNMYPFEFSQNFTNEIINYFRDIATPFLNNIKINKNKYYKNKNNTTPISEIQYKFNQTIAKKINQLAGEDKTLLILFNHYFIYVPLILNEFENNTNISIQFLFYEQVPSLEKFTKIPNYKTMIKSILYSNIIYFTSFINCHNFSNLVKLLIDNNLNIQCNNDTDIIIYNQNTNRNTLLKVENILPDFRFIKSVYNEKKKSNEISQNLKMLEKLYENKFLFVSIDHVKYLPFIKLKILAFKQLFEELIEEKKKIFFVQIITGKNKNVENANLNNSNINNNININEEQKNGEEKDNINSVNDLLTLVKKINDDIGSNSIEIIFSDITVHEKIFLLKNADCFIKTVDDINSPLSIYEFIMIKLMDESNKNQESSNKNQENDNKNKEDNNKNKEDNKNNNTYPNIEYILSNQIREVPGINNYISVNPFDIKNISNGLNKAYKNLLSNKNKKDKEKDFNFIKKYMYNEKQFYKSSSKDLPFQTTSGNNLNLNNANPNNELTKININDVSNYYSNIINQSDSNDIINDNININDNLKNIENESVYKILSINIDYFFETLNDEKKKKFIELFENLLNLSKYNSNNKIILFCNKEQNDIDNFFKNELNEKTKSLIKENRFNNFFIISANIYSFKKINEYIEVNNWVKINIDDLNLKSWEDDFIATIYSYKKNCRNLKTNKKYNKVYISTEDCNEEQVEIYIDMLKIEINNSDILKKYIEINKIQKGYCIVNKYINKGFFISRLIKEIINKDNKIKFILHLGFDESDDIVFNYLDTKKNVFEKYSKNEVGVFAIKISESGKDNSKNIKNKNLYYIDNIDDIISMIKNFVESEKKMSKK